MRYVIPVVIGLAACSGRPTALNPDLWVPERYDLVSIDDLAIPVPIPGDQYLRFAIQGKINLNNDTSYARVILAQVTESSPGSWIGDEGRPTRVARDVYLLVNGDTLQILSATRLRTLGTYRAIWERRLP